MRAGNWKSLKGVKLFLDLQVSQLCFAKWIECIRGQRGAPESALKRASSRNTTWRRPLCYCESHCGQRRTPGHVWETRIQWQASYQNCHGGSRRGLNAHGRSADWRAAATARGGECIAPPWVCYYWAEFTSSSCSLRTFGSLTTEGTEETRKANIILTHSQKCSGFRKYPQLAWLP